jgi:hypothetical protein
MQREARHHIPASFEQLSKAREETRKQKERGWLRPPCRWRVAELKIGDQVIRAVVPTKAEELRQAAGASARRVGSLSVVQEVPLWAKGMPFYSAEIPCDPLGAVRHAMQQRRDPNTVPTWLRRRWRPRRR